MALNKVANSKVGNFGSLTKTNRQAEDKSIFGKNGCCSYEDSFISLSMGDGSAFDVFSKKGKENLEKEIAIIEGKTKNNKPKSFEMNMKAYAMLQEELGLNEKVRHITV